MEEDHFLREEQTNTREFHAQGDHTASEPQGPKKRKRGDHSAIITNFERIFDDRLLDGIPEPSEELCLYIQNVAQNICMTNPKRNKMFRSLHPSSLAALGMLMQTYTHSLLESLAKDISEEEIPDKAGNISERSRPMEEDDEDTHNSEYDPFIVRSTDEKSGNITQHVDSEDGSEEEEDGGK